MIYRIHTNDPINGWSLTKQSSNLEDFSSQEKWAFLHIEITGCEYVKMGDTMWDISQGTK